MRAGSTRERAVSRQPRPPTCRPCRAQSPRAPGACRATVAPVSGTKCHSGFPSFSNTRRPSPPPGSVRAVISAVKGLTSPPPTAPLLSNSSRKPWPTLRQGMNARPRVRSRPVTPRLPSIGDPQAKALTESIIEFCRSIAPPPPGFECGIDPQAHDKLNPSVAENLHWRVRSARHTCGFLAHVACSSGSPSVKLNHTLKWPGIEEPGTAPR